MRKKLMLLSALTCLTGGWALLGPAEAQRRYPSCEALVNTSCAGPNPAYQRCTRESGATDILYCWNDWWVWA
ncbi:MAG: hypothetical protein ABW277_20965 [Longimicrobiaceae bacterium]